MQTDHEKLAPITPELLERFRAQAWRQVRPLIRVAVVAGAILFALFVGWELVAAPEILPRTVPIRMVITTGMLAWLPAMRVKPFSDRPELIFYGATTWAAASVSFLATVLPHADAFAVGALMLILLVVATLAPSLIQHLLACALLALSSNAIALWWPAPRSYLLATNVFLVSSIALSSFLVHLNQRARLRTFRLEAKLQSLASTDALTGAMNRRALLAAAEDARQRSDRYGEPLSLVMLDIDSFKTINDTWGHPAGDEVIRTVAQRCNSAARRTDLLGRIGGEEFVLVLPHTSGEAAAQMAERLRQEIASAPVDIGGRLLTVTISLGTAECHPGERLDSWFARADGALYTAKRAGRNRVSSEPPEPAFDLGIPVST